MSSTPDIPSPKPAAKPVAPLVNNSGYFQKLNEQKTKKGFLSTFLGGRGSGDSVVPSAAQRLSEYLSSAKTQDLTKPEVKK